MKNKTLLCVMAWSLAFSQVPCVTAMAEEESEVLVISPAEEEEESDTLVISPAEEEEESDIFVFSPSDESTESDEFSSPSDEYTGPYDIVISPSDENTEDDFVISPEIDSKDTTDSEEVMPNPIVEYKTLKQSEEKAGFTLQVASGIKGYKQAGVSLIDGKLLQVNYKSSTKKKTILIRKAKGSDNISGDYNVYKSTTNVTINGAKVQFKGTDKTVTTATWTSGGFSYSVTTSKPISRSAMTKIVKKVK